MTAMLVSAEIIIDDNFNTYDAIESVCQAQTEILQNPDGVLLGGPGKNGDWAGLRFKKDFSVDQFYLLVEKISWSHNSPAGGHPTQVKMLNRDGAGYIVSIVAGKLSLLVTDGKGEPKVLAQTKDLWRGNEGYTQNRDLYFARNADGEIEVKLTGMDAPLKVKDDTVKTLNDLVITYGVFIHGYSLKIGGVTLRNDPATAAGAFSASPDAVIGVIDAEAGLNAVKQRNLATVAALKLQKKNYKIAVIPGGELASRMDQFELIIVPGNYLNENDLPALLDFLRRGKAVILWGAPKWTVAAPESLAAQHRFYERILGVWQTPELKNCNPPAVTAAAKAYPKLAQIDYSQLQTLPLLDRDNTISKQALLPDVKKTSLLDASYEAPNWISQKDRFTGTVLQKLEFESGEFAGSRVIYCALPLTGSSPANPDQTQFADFMATLADIATVKTVTAPGIKPFQPPFALTRQNLFDNRQAAYATLCFASYAYLDDPIFVEDLNLADMQVVCYCIPWLFQQTGGEIVDWQRLDEIVNKVGSMGKKLMLDPYPWNFRADSFAWKGNNPGYVPEVETVYLDALQKIAKRYQNNPTLAAMWITPYTHEADFHVYQTPEVKKLWNHYLLNVRKFTVEELVKRYRIALAPGQEIPLPAENPDQKYNIGPMWNDYFDFHLYYYQNFVRKSIQTVRQSIPDLPLTIRCAFMDPALSMEVASEFQNVAAHIECIETSINTEGFFRSYGLGFGIPLTAENGWPKCSPAATRMALADYLMGNYALLTYSFGGPRWARESYGDFQQVAKIKAEMGKTVYPECELGLLLPDSTLYASKPANFFSIEKMKSLELTLEQMTYPFAGVSAERPRFNRLKVILDANTNKVFSPLLKKELAKWIADGGTFVMFPGAGEFCRDGSGAFTGQLDIKNQPGEYRVGKGKVVILDNIDNYGPPELDRLFARLGLRPTHVLSTPVCNTLLLNGDKKYLIMFDKQRQLVGSFFTESTHEAVVKSLAAKTVEITPAFKFVKATDMMTGQPLPVKQGKVAVKVEGARMAVVKFE